LKVTPSTQDFQATVSRPNKDEFKIEVKPKDTSKMFAGVLTIQPDDTQKLSYVNMRVMGPTPSTVPVPAQPGTGKAVVPGSMVQPGGNPMPAASTTPSTNH